MLSGLQVPASRLEGRADPLHATGKEPACKGTSDRRHGLSESSAQRFENSFALHSLEGG
jgi:hypothetical protein